MTMPSRVIRRRHVFAALAGGDQLDRDRSVAGDLRRERAAAVDQGFDGDHHLDLDVDVSGGGLSGEAFDEGVGHDLPATAGDRFGLDGDLVHGGGQCCVAGHGLADRQVGGEVGHPVGGRAHRHPAT